LIGVEDILAVEAYTEEEALMEAAETLKERLERFLAGRDRHDGAAHLVVLGD
jgi:hypothetical protein